ncbi:hypothetical protein SteCoe_18712 [Stentor coeruleus]|uniref:Uncharacterized protein n=1 Tax=Stentor coeruleus TaxID=5963 RepID=A0A1R2BWC1_9CILI|nr:hypothetical protein SteCoe_18712 [Stentor coeruleus]
MEDFHEELFSCQKTPGLFCFLSMFSCIGGPCCVQGKVVSDYTQKSCLYHCALPCLCLCIGASINRQVLRQQLGMDKVFIKDCVLHMFCNVCAVNQEFLEAHRHRLQGNVNMLNLKNSTATNKRSFTPNAPVDLIV